MNNQNNQSPSRLFLLKKKRKKKEKKRKRKRKREREKEKREKEKKKEKDKKRKGKNEKRCEKQRTISFFLSFFLLSSIFYLLSSFFFLLSSFFLLLSFSLPFPLSPLSSSLPSPLSLFLSLFLSLTSLEVINRRNFIRMSILIDRIGNNLSRSSGNTENCPSTRPNIDLCRYNYVYII